MNDKPTDFNDAAKEYGKESVKQQLQEDIAAINAARQGEGQQQAQPLEGETPDKEPSGEPPTPDSPPGNAARHDDSWLDLMEVNQSGGPKASVRNTELVLRNDEHWRGVLAYCDFSYRILKRKAPPMNHCDAGEWDDHDAAALRVWMSHQYEFTPSHSDIADAVMVVAKANRFHPVRTYLHSLTWDGTPRLKDWLVTGLGAKDDSRYLSIIGTKFLIGAVARVMRPGCKMDQVLILEGEQGEGKSTAIAVLFGDWFTDAPLPLGDKDAYQVLQGKWGFELAELDAFNKAEVTHLKHFFSQSTDRFRPSYGRVALDHPRQTVFLGTTNQDAYLRDYTGNRRFWPAYCALVCLEWLRQHRDQLWAEAMHLYQSGEQWWITPEEKAVVEEAQDARLQRDAWEDVLIDYLGTITKPHLTAAEILTDGIGLDPGHIQQAHMNRLAPIMKALGWRSTRKRFEDKSTGKVVQRRVWINESNQKKWDQVPL